MKKLSAILATLLYFSSYGIANAITTIGIKATDLPGYHNISEFINASLRLAFIVALLAVLVMLVWGALAWIVSGGEKEAIAEARKRIINALIGLVILAVAFAITNLAGTFVGVDLLQNFTIPTPAAPTPIISSPSPGS